MGRVFEGPPILIGGCGRSGTSLLLSMLSAHPSIHSIPYETRAFTATLYSSDPDPDAEFRPWRLHWALAQAEISVQARRWCEKTPKNVVVMDRIHSYFDGDVRLIHVVRDGRDVVTSRHPSDPSRYWVQPRRWVEDVSAGLRFSGLAGVHTVRYEDLVLNTSEVLDHLGEFLGEDLLGLERHWVESTDVEFFDQVGLHIARPLDDEGIGRWKRAEHRKRAQELVATPGAKELLSSFGYAS